MSALNGTDGSTTTPQPGLNAAVDSFGRLFTLPTHQNEIAVPDTDIHPISAELPYPTGVINLANLEATAAPPTETPPQEEPSSNLIWGDGLSKRTEDTELNELKELVSRSSIGELLQLSVQAEVDGDLNASTIVDKEFGNRVQEIKQATGNLASVVDLFLKRKQLADELWAERIKNTEVPLIPELNVSASIEAPAIPIAEPVSVETSGAENEVIAQEQDSLLAIAEKWQESKGSPEVIEESKKALQDYLKQIYSDLATGVDPLKDLGNHYEIQQVVDLIHTFLKEHLTKEDGSPIDPEIAANLSYALQKSALEKFRPSEIPRSIIADGPIRNIEASPTTAETAPDNAGILKKLASEWEKSGKDTNILNANAKSLENELIRLVNTIHEGKSTLSDLFGSDVQPVLDLLGNFLSKSFYFEDDQGKTIRLSTHEINVLIGNLKRSSVQS